MEVRRTSVLGSKAREGASILLDAVIAILILSIGIGAAAFSLAATTRRGAEALPRAVSLLKENGTHETAAFDAR